MILHILQLFLNGLLIFVNHRIIQSMFI